MIVRRALKAASSLGSAVTVSERPGHGLSAQRRPSRVRQQMAHESARTTKLYDRRNDQVTLDQVERIVL